MINQIKSILPKSTVRSVRNLIQRYQAFRLRGDAYHCPFCNHKFSAMLPAGEKHEIIQEKKIIGAGYRENALCPRCYSTDRDRLLYLYLSRKTNIERQEYSILHIAPEKSLKNYLKSFSQLHYEAGDKFDEGYENAYYDQDVMHVDLLDINKPDHSVDIVICNHVLEHIENDRQAMSEIYRIMRIGGWGILQVPISPILESTFEQPTTSPQEREHLFGQKDHVRLYGKDYKERLESIGFRVSTIHMNEVIPTEKMKIYGINPDELIYLVRKA